MLVHLFDLRSALLTHPACGVVESRRVYHFFASSTFCDRNKEFKEIREFKEFKEFS